jgi:hypothetical protein
VLSVELFGCSNGNLKPIDDSLSDLDLMFIHLGPSGLLDPDGPTKRYGNDCSMEFLRANITRLANVCVIAYSGGERIPDEFDSIRKLGWHQFFERIHNANAFNIGKFCRLWKSQPDGAPPFSALLDRGQGLETLRMMIANYQEVCKRAGGSFPSDKQSVHLAKWRVMFDGGAEFERLLVELVDAQEHRLAALAKRIAIRVAAFDSSAHAVDVSWPSPELHSELLGIDIYNAGSNGQLK